MDASHSFEACFKRATSPLAVLRFLRERSMCGYEISYAMNENNKNGVCCSFAAHAAFCSHSLHTGRGLPTAGEKYIIYR